MQDTWIKRILLIGASNMIVGVMPCGSQVYFDHTINNTRYVAAIISSNIGIWVDY